MGRNQFWVVINVSIAYLKPYIIKAISAVQFHPLLLMHLDLFRKLSNLSSTKIKKTFLGVLSTQNRFKNT